MITTLAEFEIDTDKAKAELDSLTKRLYDLGQQTKAASKDNSELQKSINSLEKEQKSANGITAEQSKNLSDLRNKQLEVLKTQQSLANQTSVVKNEYNYLNNAVRTRLTSEGESLKMAAAIDAALKREVNSIDSARKSISEMTKLRNQLNPAIEEERVLLENLNDKIDANTEFVKSNASAMEQQKMNIGNYKDSVKEAINESNLFNGSLSGLIGASQKAGGAGGLLKSTFASVTTGLISMTKAALAFILTPLGIALTALVAVFTLLKNAINSNAESTAKISLIFAKLGGVMNGLLKAVEPLASFLVDVLVKAFEMTAEVITFVFDAVTNATAAVLEFFGATESSNAVKNFNKEMKESVKIAEEIVKAEAAANAARREAKKTMLDYQNQAENLRQVRDNITLSEEKRMKAAKEVGAVLEKQSQVEKELAKQSVVLAQLRIKEAGGYNKAKSELKDALADAETELIDIEERINGQRSEQITSLNSLEKEFADKRDENAEKAYQADIKRMNDGLAYFIASQGEKARTLEEELKLAQQISDKKLAIVKKEFENGKKSRLEYDTAVLEEQNVLAAKQAEITIDNAKRELDEYIRINNDKYLDKQRLNSELLTLETDRLTSELTKQKEFAQLQFDQGVIDKNAYNNEMLLLDSEYNERKKTLNLEFEATKAEDEALKRELDKEANLLALADDAWSQFEAERINNEAINVQKKIDLDKQKADGLISQENYNKALVNLETEKANIDKSLAKQVQSFKIDIASQTAGNLASILGKETAAGKAAAIAQTTIDTYKAATSAYSAMSGIPVVGPALGAIAAAAAVVSGVKSVKEIIATKTPNTNIQGLITGGEVAEDGFAVNVANGDNRLITAKTGEVMLSEQSRAYLGDSLLSQAGVPGLSGAASSSLDSGNMANDIANAVYQASLSGTSEGTARGAASGIVGLSDNRVVSNNATF